MRQDLVINRNSAVIAAAILATAGLGIFLASDANGNMDRRIGTAIAVIPVIGATLAQYFGPPSNIFAIYMGLAAGICVPLLTTRSNLPFLVGTLVAGTTAAAVSAFTKKLFA